MNWLNLETNHIRKPEFVGSEPTARATWHCIIVYCVEQENGGRIVGARLWKDRQWQQTCGVTLEEINGSTLLLKWEGNDLLVWAYPTDKEAEVQKKRSAGRNGGKAQSEAKSAAAKTNGATGGRPITQAETQAQSSNNPSTNPTERKGREVEEEKKENDLFCAEVAEPPAAPKDPVLIFPCAGSVKSWELTEEKLSEWQDTYEEMDVMEALRHARQWCRDNAKKRKTAQGMPRFIGTWLSTAQNKGQHRRTGGSAPVSYWTPTHPDAFRPQDELLREAFKRSHGDNPKAAAILEKLDQMHNGSPAPL